MNRAIRPNDIVTEFTEIITPVINGLGLATSADLTTSVRPADSDIPSSTGDAPRCVSRLASICRPRWMRTPSVLGLQPSSAAICSRVRPP